MPICNNEELRRLLRIGRKPRIYQNDNERVFYCSLSKKIFRDYEEYALRIFANSATIWKCRSTGRENLTYSEALKSEKHARRDKHTLNEHLCSVVLIFIKTVKQSSFKHLLILIFEFLRSRIFINERVRVLQECYKKNSFIVASVKPKHQKLPTFDKITYRPDQVEYVVKSVNENYTNELTVQFEQIKRHNDSLSKHKVREFIEKNVIPVDGILQPTPDSYKKYVTNKKLSFEKVFIGKIPSFYNQQKEKFVKEKAIALSRQTDDLERYDQKLLPKYEEVKTNIPIEYFGDILMLSEFLHSFSKMHSFKNVFKKNITLSELTRAFTTCEIDGPLSEILINLLQTIFNLQKDEESEYPVMYTSIEKNKTNFEPYKTMNEANGVHEYVDSHFCTKLNDLPLNVYTLSEVLRLHFLASGAQVSNATEMYRQMYRNGYSSTEDPGLIFCKEQPVIVEFLKSTTVYHLPKFEIFQIINTLIAQILSYSSAITLIEKQMDRITKLKKEIKATRLLKEKHNKIIETRISPKRNYKINKLSQTLFGFKAFLGMDRAYRKYYVLRSIPGVFVEHPLDSIKECLQNPPKNVPSFVNHPRQRWLIENYLSKLYNHVKKNQSKSYDVQNNNNNLENGNSNIQTNPELNYKMETDVETAEETLRNAPTQYELMMCTGNPNNCIVHDVNNPDRQRWAYFYKEEHIDTVIQNLNPYGDRERDLKKKLSMMRDLIVNHVKNCPVDTLSSNYSSYVKLNAHNRETPEPDINEKLYLKIVDQIFKIKNDIKDFNIKSNIKIQLNTINLPEDIESSDKSSIAYNDTHIKNTDDLKVRKYVKKLCWTVLNIKQSINIKYFKHKELKHWESSLMSATSYSQVFLHLNILHGAIQWPS